MYLCAGVPPINLLAQNFGGLNLSSPPHVTPIRPQANPMTMGMPATGIPTAMTANMPPSMTTGTVGMGGIPVNQGVMGMNMSMNMGMTTPVMMGGMAGMGVPGVGMGLTHSMAPAMVPPKHDAFANFGSFGKWRSVCLWMWVCVYFIERIVDEWWQCMSDLMRVWPLKDCMFLFLPVTVTMTVGDGWEHPVVLLVWEARKEDALRAGKVLSLCSNDKKILRLTCFSFLFLFFVWYGTINFPFIAKMLS